jgi:hypothetical protein
MTDLITSEAITALLQVVKGHGGLQNTAYGLYPLTQSSNGREALGNLDSNSRRAVDVLKPGISAPARTPSILCAATRQFQIKVRAAH